MPTIVSWNVAGRVRAVGRQAEALATQHADVVALQEVRTSSADAWTEALAQLGLTHVLTSLEHVEAVVPPRPDRRLAVLIAAREPLEAVPVPVVPWPERLLAARVHGVEFFNLHSPISSKPDEVKVRTLEAVFGHLAQPAGGAAQVFAGDLNTPQYESREGEVQSFARTRGGRIRRHLGERHDRAERSVITGLLEHGWNDAFRTLHGYGRRDRSWLYPHGKMGYRLDHILVRGLEVVACEYRHDWRDAGLSDHAAMWAELREPSG